MVALALPALLDRARAMLVLMKDFATEDFRSALDAFPASLGGERSQDFTIMFEEWVSHDPEAAMKYAADDHSMQEVAARIWVDSDVEAALAWAKGDPDVRRLGAVISRLAKQDPALAAGYSWGTAFRGMEAPSRRHRSARRRERHRGDSEVGSVELGSAAGTGSIKPTPVNGQLVELMVTLQNSGLMLFVPTSRPSFKIFPP